MSLNVNLAQINSAARGNSDLRETLTSLHLAVQSLYAQTGAAPLAKVDSRSTSFVSAPAQCRLSVTGANGSFMVSITLPQQASGSTKPGNATKAPIYQEITSSTSADFSSGNFVYPVSTNTSYVFPNPGATLYWRLRSSYNQQTWNGYSKFSGPVSAGLQTSAATQPNLSLNQTNYATVDSVADGATATVRIYGSGGVGTSWSSVLGTSSKVIPSGTIMNVAYGTNGYVVWDGSMYQIKAALSQTFPDGWIPVGKVSVISNGAGLALPTITPVISGGHIIGYNISSGGNDITGPLSFAIFDSGGGSGASVGTQTVNAGALTFLGAGNPGANYTGATTVTASGGVSAGFGGGGGPTGQNTGRLYGNTV